MRPQLEELEARHVLSGVAPTAVEQLMLEELNDARTNPPAYGASIGVDLSNVAPSQPLAWDPMLIQAALGHSQDMSARNYFAHVTPDGVDPGGRIAAAGYGAVSWGESIAAGYTSPAAALAGLITDSGVPDLGHRRHLLAIDATFRDQNAAGIGIVLNGSGTYQDYYTIDTAEGSDSRPYLTGVVYNDLNGNGKYDIGEGLGGVTVTVKGAGSATTFDTGGYSLQLSAGTYTVTFSGGGLPASVSETVSVGATNYRLNLTSAQAKVSQAAGDPATSAWLTQQYETLLGRAPGPADFNYWLGVLQNGGTEAQVAAAIAASPEHVRFDNSQWIAQIYPGLVGRPAVANDLNYWLGVLQSGTSRQDVVTSIMQSVEYRRFDGAQWLPQIYQRLLGRAPRPADYTYWLNVLAGGAARDQVIASIVVSPEYHSHLTNQPSAWLDQVYVQLLGRHAGSGDLTYWLGVLNSGTSESGVVQQIMQSTEYQGDAWRNWIGQLYTEFLGRNAGSADLNYWTSAWQTGTSPAGALTAILNSPEFRGRAGGQTG
jgi:uncharacterized protein YkwD